MDNSENNQPAVLTKSVYVAERIQIAWQMLLDHELPVKDLRFWGFVPNPFSDTSVVDQAENYIWVLDGESHGPFALIDGKENDLALIEKVKNEWLQSPTYKEWLSENGFPMGVPN